MTNVPQSIEEIEARISAPRENLRELVEHAAANSGAAELLSGGKVLAGSLSTSKSWIYYIATNTWTQSGSKVYNDRSDEESWVRLPDGRVMTYTFVSLLQLQ